MTLPQIGQLCLIYHFQTNGEIPVVGMVLDSKEEELAKAYDMKEYGPKFQLWFQFLIEEQITWIPYNETTKDLIEIL